MKKCLFSALVVSMFATASLTVPMAHAVQDDDAAHFSIMAPVHAAYKFYRSEAAKVDNKIDAVEAELADAKITAERKQTLAVAVAALRTRQAAALARLQAESEMAQLKMAALNMGSE